MLVSKWKAVERQRPQLRVVKWGAGAGAALILLSILAGWGTFVFGVIVLAVFGLWGYSALNRG